MYLFFIPESAGKALMEPHSRAGYGMSEMMGALSRWAFSVVSCMFWMALVAVTG